RAGRDHQDGPGGDRPPLRPVAPELGGRHRPAASSRRGGPADAGHMTPAGPGPPVAPLVTVVGLGPGGAGHLSEAARGALLGADVAYLRTARHPSAEGLGRLASFDHHYDEANTFDQVYARIVEDLVEAAARESAAGRRVVYGVPGSP